MRITRPAGRRRLTCVAIATGALLVPATGAAQASAATIGVTQPCYVTVNSPAMIDITGSGFTPGDTISFSGFGVAGTTAAGADGSINFVTQGPPLPFSGPGQKTFPIQAQDETAGTGFIASTNVTMANFSFSTSPSVASPSRKVTWRFSGFVPGRTIYAHYLHKNAAVNRVAFGKAKGACGTLTTRARFYPGGHPKFSRYTVVLDQVKRYTKSARPRILAPLSFF